MTSDFDNDEIQDSSFPIDFKDDTESLDMYGVWVKSGPRDAEGIRAESPATEIDDTVSFADFQDMSESPQDMSDTETRAASRAEMDEGFMDLADLPELPDFPDLETPAKEASDASETVEFEKPSDEIIEESIQEIQFEDINFDMPETIETIDQTDSIITSEAETETFETIEPLEDEETLEPEIELAKHEDFLETPSNAEIELSVDDFFQEKVSSTKETLPSDEDFSSFLDDLNTSTPQSAPQSAPISGDNLDLDSFINSVNETGGSLHEETEKLFDDTDPLNIDLEFDEDFIEDAEKIRATGSSVSESEFFNSEFGVELVDETSGETAASEAQSLADQDFNAMFDSVSEKKEIKAEATSSLEDTSEFDDLLLSLDAAPVPAPVSSKAKVSSSGVKAFNLSVTEEDGLELIASAVNETASDEDISVPLFGSGEKVEITREKEIPEAKNERIEAGISDENASELETFPADIVKSSFEVLDNVEEFLDITEIKDYNGTESSPDSEISGISSLEETVSLDFDDISAVEKELSEQAPDTGEDTVVTNDKSTELLMIIADELSSIKKEISTLKTELAGFKSGTVSDQTSQGDTNAISDNSGFFSDDDTDETIALTGDELNNILITADFTEEKSEETPAEDLSVIPGTLEAEAPVMKDIVSPAEAFQADEPEIPETLPDHIFDIPGFTEETPVVAHVNSINDDVSYLDGAETVEPDLDNVAIEEPELEIIDFNDEKLEEPELAEFNIDLSDMETSFPTEQEVAIPSSEVAEEFTEPEEVLPSQKDTSIPEIDDFPMTDTLSEQELAAVGEDIALSEESIPEEPLYTESATPAPSASSQATVGSLPVELKDEIKSVLTYMDQLLESLPEDKIEEFARSEHFEVYKKLFEELGIS